MLCTGLLVFGLAWTALAQYAGGGRIGSRSGETQDFAGLSFTDIEPAGVRSPGPGEDGTLQSQETRVFASVPVYGKGTDTVWSAGVMGEQLNLHFAGFSPLLKLALISDLYGAGVNGAVYHRIDPEHGVLGYLATGEYSDGWLPSGGRRTFGGGLWQVRTSPSSTWGLGGGFTYVFGEPRAVPLVTYAYREGPWTANVRFPFRADARYALSEWVRVGAETFVQGGEFSVHDPSASVDTVRTTSQLVGALVAIGPVSGPQVQIDAGTSVYRHYTALNDRDTVVSLGFHDAMFYRAGLAVRF